MKIVFFGTPEFAVPSLERLLAHPDFNVVAVVTQPDKRRGRGNQLIPSPVKTLVQAILPVWQPRSVKKELETLEKLRLAEADVFVVVAYGQILSQAILDMPRLGCVNAHGSILPKYRGAAPIQWSIYHGEAETGITTMLMDAGMDTGAMLTMGRIAIAPLTNAQDLAAQLSLMSADLLVETLLQLNQGTAQPIPQDHAQATYAPLIKKEDYELDWSKSAIALHNQVRGFFPSCSTIFRGETLKVMATIPLDPAYLNELPSDVQIGLKGHFDALNANSEPGTIAAIAKGLGAIVQTGNGQILLKEIQLSGKRPQSGADFANGTRLAIGEKVGKPNEE
ncbi:methionyl-tRNA formyltransferase [Phormidium sp. CLA17]|uniref:methionyl-tRNA formyltransferase n=1 Tax=Leptolyngbya sp. Cla-17 TaxID=2803751 RepID=UPI0014908C8A|nr:methionyl-tRNA formyltransferase [Leptolyngbya sp. Cla-17]MBM0741179.1 methionyl-tRNA formyltransferase [Leptolyngbya sp. Cla-17]